MLSTHFQNAGAREIMNAAYNDITGWVTQDATTRVCTADRLRAYGTLSTRFRNNLANLWILDDFDSGAPQVAQQLEANGQLLADLNAMLRVIIDKRTRALGAVERRGTGCQHYGYFVD